MNFFNRLTAGERLAAIGAVIVIISALLAIVTAFGFGLGIIALLGAIAVLVIYYLKYSPTQTINWPAPIPLIVLGVSGVTALLAILTVLPLLGLLAFLGIGMLFVLGTVVGSLIMVWGAWQEYQAMPRTSAASPGPGTPTTTSTGPTTTSTGPTTTSTGPTTTSTGETTTSGGTTTSSGTSTGSTTNPPTSTPPTAGNP